MEWEIKSSPTIEIVNEVRKMKSSGKDVISLAVGDPDIPTPKGIIEAAHDGMRKGMTHYAPSRGIESFRLAAASKVRRRNGINAAPENIVFISSKFSIYATMLSVTGERNEILIPDPGYFYSEPALLAGLRPIYYSHDDDFTINIEDLKSKIGKKTAAIVLNSPSNPTGRIQGKDILRSILEISEDNHNFVISDEAYEDIIYGMEKPSLGSMEENINNVISVFSLSKSYSMTGWRAGYTVANESITDRISRIIENTVTSYPPFIQKAAEFALNNGDGFIDDIKHIMKERKELVSRILSGMELLVPNNIEGTFYSFPEIENISDTEEFCRRLLMEENVAVLPGSVFGPAGRARIRISFSTSESQIIKGLSRIEKFLDSHYKN